MLDIYRHDRVMQEIPACDLPKLIESVRKAVVIEEKETQGEGETTWSLCRTILACYYPCLDPWHPGRLSYLADCLYSEVAVFLEPPPSTSTMIPSREEMHVPPPHPRYESTWDSPLLTIRDDLVMKRYLCSKEVLFLNNILVFVSRYVSYYFQIRGFGKRIQEIIIPSRIHPKTNEYDLIMVNGGLVLQDANQIVFSALHITSNAVYQNVYGERSGVHAPLMHKACKTDGGFYIDGLMASLKRMKIKYDFIYEGMTAFDTYEFAWEEPPLCWKVDDEGVFCRLNPINQLFVNNVFTFVERCKLKFVKHGSSEVEARRVYRQLQHLPEYYYYYHHSQGMVGLPHMLDQALLILKMMIMMTTPGCSYEWNLANPRLTKDRYHASSLAQLISNIEDLRYECMEFYVFNSRNTLIHVYEKPPVVYPFFGEEKAMFCSSAEDDAKEQALQVFMSHVLILLMRTASYIDLMPACEEKSLLMSQCGFDPKRYNERNGSRMILSDAARVLTHIASSSGTEETKRFLLEKANPALLKKFEMSTEKLTVQIHAHADFISQRWRSTKD